MNAMEYRADDGQSGLTMDPLWVCTECHRAYNAEPLANSCCVKGACDTCASETSGPSVLRCRDCQESMDLATAEVVPETEVVFDVGTQGYFKGVRPVVEHYELIGEDPPERVFACESMSFSLDLEGAIDCAHDELNRDDGPVDLVGYDELKAAVDAFNELQPAESWFATDKACLVPRGAEGSETL